MTQIPGAKKESEMWEGEKEEGDSLLGNGKHQRNHGDIGQVFPHEDTDDEDDSPEDGFRELETEIQTRG